MKHIISKKSFRLAGEAKVPGDKSISHRALIISSMCIGQSKIKGLLESEDVFATMNALKTLGVKIEKSNGYWFVNGVGIFGFKEPTEYLDLGNSGTGARLILGAIMGSSILANLKGDASLSKRPMGRVLTPLKMMGAKIISSNNEKLPITIKGPKEVFPINYSSKISSAQIKSSILLSGLAASGRTIFKEPNESRNHTEKMLSSLGANIQSKTLEDGSYKVELGGNPVLRGSNINVPCDPSSAAFLVVAAVICPESKIELKNVMINKGRSGLFETLKEMGAKINIFDKKNNGGEETASIIAEYSHLKGITVPSKRVPSMIDEYPILSIAASCAEGKTVMDGISELRVKESDRIKIVSNGLIKAGVKTIEKAESLTIYGSKVVGGCSIDSELDHRIAMSFLILGLISKEPIKVLRPSTIETSFPNFYKIMIELGANFTKA
jgi:3-phosphoshikimate 1-carboxyvinyltransferase